MKQNIFVLPTNGESRLHLANNKTIIKSLEPTGESDLYKSVPIHIYITNNEDIKEDVYQWYIDSVLNEPYNSGGAQYSSKQNVVLLTTDPKLIADGVQEINDDFLNWFVNNSSCEYVEVKSFCKYGDNCPSQGAYDKQSLCDIGYKIVIPQEEPKQEFKYIGECKGNNDNGCFMDSPAHNCGCFTRVSKQETIEEAAINYSIYNEQTNKAIQEAVIFGAKWQAEKSFTLDQIDKLFIGEKGGYFDDFLDYRLGLQGNQPNKITFKEWFEQHKKNNK